MKFIPFKLLGLAVVCSIQSIALGTVLHPTDGATTPPTGKTAQLDRIRSAVLNDLYLTLSREQRSALEDLDEDISRLRRMDQDHGDYSEEWSSTASALAELGELRGGLEARQQANQLIIPPPRKELIAMKDSARITMVQLQDDGNPDSALQRMKPFFEQAREYGTDLIVFPEYILGNRIEITHERVEQFRAMAREFEMYAIAGLVEKHAQDQWATTAIVVDRHGNILGRYLKSHPASGPAPHWWPPLKEMDSEAKGILGNQFKVFHLDFGTIGILQCYDGYFPEAWGCTSYLGAELILWINGRDGTVEDPHCIFAAQAYGCVVGANITNGRNTGFAGPWGQAISAEGEPEEARLFPRIDKPGDACVHATVDLKWLRWHRKHLRTMHQRRPEMYGLLTQDVKMWQDYPTVPWDYPECVEFLNKSQL